MMRGAAVGLWLAATLPAAAADYQPGAPLDTFAGARADFAFRCKGCHGFAGEGTPGHVPRLDGFVGLFTQVDGGRNYLMRVPGVARAKLDDARLAAVLNWMLEVYGGDAVKPDFAPYTAAEVGMARREPLTATRAETRATLVRELRDLGLIAPDADAGLPLVELADSP
jgi:mono/diheme cytochrome c family protein